MNANKTTTIIAVLTAIATLLTALTGYIPVEYTVYVVIATTLLSEFINYLKSGFEDKAVEQ